MMDQVTPALREVIVMSALPSLRDWHASDFFGQHRAINAGPSRPVQCAQLNALTAPRARSSGDPE